jgi:hypothetical protein
MQQGCNAVSDFEFTRLPDALIASQALLNQVFLGTYDTNPELTVGCTSTSSCHTATPYGFSGSNVAVISAFNNEIEVDDSIVSFATWTPPEDTGGFQNVVYAAWAPFPEPTTSLLLTAGLAGLAAARRRGRLLRLH